MKTRLEMMAYLPMHSVGAEVGVFTGRFSAEILNIVRPQKLYLVDPWVGFMQSGVHDDNVLTEAVDLSTIPPLLKKRFAGDPVEIVISQGDKWMLSLPQHHLDWVYIDSSHQYEETLKELDAAMHAVKPGGYICGHDWQMGEVRTAVEKFCQMRDLNPSTTTYAAQPSWIVPVRKQ